MSLCKELSFKNIKGEKLKNKINQYIDKIEFNLNEFYLYFCAQWLPFFNNESLFLNDINIKFSTNNNLDHFNRLFKSYFDNKIKNINILEYNDILVEEVIKHENLLIDENKNPLKPISA